jgi:hypothetical protein
VVEVIDNFLPENLYLPIREQIMGSETIDGVTVPSMFPWYFNNFVISEKNNNSDFQFVHNFFRLNYKSGYQEVCSPFCKVIQPIVDKLNAFCLIRIKANLSTITVDNKNTGYHTDYSVYDGCTSAIFYLNTNNGYTLFKDTEEKIDCVANRLIKFNSRLMHAGVTSNNTTQRVTINFNYIEKKE